MRRAIMAAYPLVDMEHKITARDIPMEIPVVQMKTFGGVILRNLASDKSDFMALTERIAPGIERGVVRTENSLKFHGELYFVPWPPDVLWFYCVEPASTGGQTLLCDGVSIMSDMRKDTIAFFSENPLIYDRVLKPSQWRIWFNTDRKEEVADRIRSYPSLSGTFAEDLLHIQFRTYAIRQTKWSGSQAFISSLLHALDSTQRTDIQDYGLITIIPAAIRSELRDLTAKHTFAIEWQSGDIVMIDNTRVMHARRAFRGRREIVAVNGKAIF
jgi:hypothetical protein